MSAELLAYNLAVTRRKKVDPIVHDVRHDLESFI
jgi:hypothetical protein